MLQFKDKSQSNSSEPWYSSWFNEELYDAIYSHRSESEAKDAVALLANLLSPYSKDLMHSFILDVGCGNCRHLPYLRTISRNIIGLDLSFRQLKNGETFLTQNECRLQKQLVRSDMRFLPIQQKSLGLITNFFTSFGYFNCDSEHQATLNNWALSLAKNGLIFIDLFNRNYVIDSLQKFTGTKFKDYSIEQHRHISIDRKRVEKEITINFGAENKVFKESVRLFSLEELTKMLFLSGLKIIEIKGSYKGDNYNNYSERLIIIAQKF